MKRKFLTAVCTTLLLASTANFAEEFEVQMLNQGTDGVMVFEPSVLQIQVGDTVTFSHNSGMGRHDPCWSRVLG